VGGLVQELLGIDATGNGRLMGMVRNGRLWGTWSATAV